MAPQTLLAFVLTSFALVASPGPVTLLTLRHLASGGWGRARWVMLGGVLGDMLAIGLSLAGLASLITASPLGIITLRFIGGVILLALGLGSAKRALTPPAGTEDNAAQLQPPFRSAFALTALHPVGLVFYIGFVPLFLDPARPLPAQGAVLTLTFGAVTASVALLTGLVGTALLPLLRRPATKRFLDGLSALVFMGLGFSALVLSR